MKKSITLLVLVITLNASQLTTTNNLTLLDAIDILKSQNLEIKTAHFDIDAAMQDLKTISAKHWGKVDFIQEYATSNDAGNVFGFKLTSREADFNDFGFNEFLAQMNGLPANSGALLATQPKNLNYPDSRNFFQSKVKYEVPLFTGFALSSYEDIMHFMIKMKSLEKDEIVNEKIYQLRKTFYDMALIQNSYDNLTTIYENIEKLEEKTQSMLDVGYAKKVDLLEVQAKKANVKRLLSQMQANQELLYHYLSFLLNQEIRSIQPPHYNLQAPSLTKEDILTNNLAIQKATTGLYIKESMLDLSKASYYPVVGAFAEIATADDSFLGEASDHKAYTVGARLTWNVFNGGIDNANLQKAKLEHLKTQTQVNLAKKGIELQIAKIRTEIESFDADITSLESELALANEIYKNYEGRYLEKLSPMSSVIIKQSEQIQKILELQRVHNKRNEKIFALEKLANGEQK